MKAKSPHDENNLYVFTQNSDNPIVYSLNDLDKITFSETGICFWNTAWPTEYLYKDFLLITFSEQNNPNALEPVKVNDNNVIISYNRLQDNILIESGNILFGVFVSDLQGRIIISDNNHSNFYQLSLHNMPKGIYIVKTFGKEEISKKIVK